jgi:hypothetical protein
VIEGGVWFAGGKIWVKIRRCSELGSGSWVNGGAYAMRGIWKQESPWGGGLGSLGLNALVEYP